MHRFLRAALAAVPVILCHTPQALAEVIDEIALERLDSAARVRLRFTGPVHYLRQSVSADGGVANVYLQALDPEAFGVPSPIDEVRHSPGNAAVPPFTVRVRLDPRCDPAPNPVCIFIRFERAARYTVRLGEDRRSLLLDFASEAGSRSPSAGKER
ncbi:MAG TPA: hypothetical protein VLV56_13410 [Burkholderiales bacterium]|nr:hypothetical protein [Burkholderiales bacterium]